LRGTSREQDALPGRIGDPCGGALDVPAEQGHASRGATNQRTADVHDAPALPPAGRLSREPECCFEWVLLFASQQREHALTRSLPADARAAGLDELAELRRRYVAGDVDEDHGAGAVHRDRRARGPRAITRQPLAKLRGTNE